MKIWDIFFNRKNYMEYLDYGPESKSERKQIEVRQLGLPKVVIVRRSK